MIHILCKLTQISRAPEQGPRLYPPQYALLHIDTAGSDYLDHCSSHISDLAKTLSSLAIDGFGGVIIYPGEESDIEIELLFDTEHQHNFSGDATVLRMAYGPSDLHPSHHRYNHANTHLIFDGNDFRLQLTFDNATYITSYISLNISQLPT